MAKELLLRIYLESLVVFGAPIQRGNARSGAPD
jgi:hypothetical protein